jgi:hypothetical protein
MGHFLRLKGLHATIAARPASGLAPPADAANAPTQAQKEQAMAYIGLAVDDTHSGHLRDITDPAQAWAKLKRIYADRATASILKHKRELAAFTRRHPRASPPTPRGSSTSRPP